MKKLPIFTVALLMGLVMVSNVSATITIDPAASDFSTNWTLNDNYWTTTDTSNLNAADLASLIGVTDLELLYKENSDATEDGTFKTSYTTSFYPAVDPWNATITWDGVPAAFIPSDPVYIIVKDGRQGDPAQYIFELSGWDGKQTIELKSFWGPEPPTVNGAISNVAIWGAEPEGGWNPVPEPGSLLLLGLGLIGIGAAARRRSKK